MTYFFSYVKTECCESLQVHEAIRHERCHVCSSNSFGLDDLFSYLVWQVVQLVGDCRCYCMVVSVLALLKRQCYKHAYLHR